jgi:ABC-type multidrug transport system fused ATPase/permease subunit
MLVSLAISITALNGIAWVAKYLVDGLIRHDAHAVKMSFLGMAAFVVVYGYFDRLQMIAREYAQGANLTQLKRRMNELFFEKSMGQHFQESSYLNTANIERHQINWDMPAIRTAMLTLTVTPDIADKPNAIKLTRKNGVRVEMRSVSYAYTAEKRDLPGLPAATNGGSKPAPPILRNVSFTIEPGDKAALIGPSGTGQTTIVRLLMRYMDPTSGAIFVDGHDLRDVRLSSWLNLIAYVPQQAQVFDGTIRDNLLYRFTDEPIKVPDQELWAES